MSKIITRDDLTAYIKKDLDPKQAQLVVDAVNAYVETQTHRCWGESKTATDERYDWQRVVYLRHQDVQAITAVNFGWPGQSSQLIPSTGYFSNRNGRVTFMSYGFVGTNYSPSTMYSDALAITYTYGVEEVPDDLKLAALGIASGFYDFAVNGGKDVIETQVGSYRIQYAGSVRGNGASEPSRNSADANFAIIDSYRMRRG